MAYKELVRSGWPGFSWADGAATQVCTSSLVCATPHTTILVCYEAQQQPSCVTILQDPLAEKEEPSQKMRNRRGGRQPGRGRRLVERRLADSKPKAAMHIGFEYESPQVQNTFSCHCRLQYLSILYKRVNRRNARRFSLLPDPLGVQSCAHVPMALQGRRCLLTAHKLPEFQASKMPPGQQLAFLLSADLPLWADLPARQPGSQRGAWGAPVNADAQPAAGNALLQSIRVIVCQTLTFLDFHHKLFIMDI